MSASDEQVLAKRMIVKAEWRGGGLWGKDGSGLGVEVGWRRQEPGGRIGPGA